MKLSEALALFIEARAAEGAADSTLTWYQQRVGRFVAWAGDPPLEAVGVGTIRGFLASLRGQVERYRDHPYKPPELGGLSPSTIRGYGRSLRQFFNFLAAEGLTDDNVMARIKLPKNGKRAPKGIAFEDLKRLLRATEQSVCPERDRALILFLADTGCRVGGLVSLTLSDLDLSKRRALVTEKGAKSRLVFFSQRTQDALRQWLSVRQTWMMVRDWTGDWVFLSHKDGGPLTPSGVNQLLRRLRKRADVSGRANPHAFRHGFAKMYLMNGGDLASLADLLGHESVETTRQFYAVFRADELALKHDRFTPVGRL